MSRVPFVVLFAALLTGCGMNLGSVSTGFTDAGPSVAPTPAAYAPSDGLALGGAAPARGAPSESANTWVTKLEDKAPSGSYEKAPKGALAGRDYSTASLSPEKARDLINQYRRAKGLKPLTLNAELTSAAKAHARDLARWDRISHFGSDGSNPWDRVKRTGYNAQVTAENVGTGQASFDEVLKGWKESPGHNKNLLMRDASHMGIALVQDPKTEFKSFWTLVLGSTM